MSVILVPFFFLCAAFAMDITKATWVKQQYQILGQEATTQAVRVIDTSGSVRPAAAQVVVDTYVDRFNGGKGDSFEGSVGVRASGCKKVKLPDGSMRRAPYMEIALAGGRNQEGITKALYVSEAEGSAVPVSGSPYVPGVKYHAVEARIYDTSPNLIFSMFGVPCQQLVTEVSSLTFGSQEDVYDWEPASPPPG